MDILPHDNVSHFPVQLPGGDYHVRVPDRKYVVKYVGVQGFHFFADLRIVMWFIILEGEFSGVMLPAYFNVQPDGKVPNGRFSSPRFTVGQKSKLAIQLGTLFSHYSPTNLPTSIPEEEMKRGTILVETMPITKDPSGHPKPVAFHGSKISRFVGWADQW